MFEVKLIRSYVLVTQLVEYNTFNVGVQSSSLCQYTIYKKKEEKRCYVERRYFRYESSQENKREWVGLFSKYYLVENR